MADDKNVICANPICSCAAEPNSKYCSTACEGTEKMDITEIGCGCAHPGCSGKVSK